MLGSILSLLVFVLACGAAATPGIVFRPGDWYQRLDKPSWRPPDRLFGPVWAVLYLTIAVSGWLIWERAEFAGATLALSIFAVQLILNGLWSWIFFGLRRPGLAFAEIVCLWLSILATIAAFYPVDAMAAAILIPYAAWVTFAVALNFRVWRLNADTALS